MEDKNFIKYLLGPENVNKSGEKKDGSDFELFLLFRLICQRQHFKNFKFFRKEKKSKISEDFVLVFDTCDDITKYLMIFVKSISDERRNIRSQDLTQNLKSEFSLPYYFDYYYQSPNFDTSKSDLKDADFEGLIFCTNIGMDKSCDIVCKMKGFNKYLYQSSGNLYKLKSIGKAKRRKIFYEQFLSERKRLANELAKYVMLKTTIDIKFLIKNKSFNPIKKFYKMLLEHVIDEENNTFKDSFLFLHEENKTESIYDFKPDKNLKEKENIMKFREDFFDSLVDFYQKYKHKSINELRKNFDFRDLQDEKINAHLLENTSRHFPLDRNNIEKILEFLRNKENILKKISDFEIIQNLATDLLLSIILQNPFDIRSVICGQKFLDKLIKIIKDDVLDLNSKKLKLTFLTDNSASNEILNNFRKCFREELVKFYNLCKDKDIKENEFYKCCKPQKSAVSLHEALKTFEVKEQKIFQFLMSREIQFIGFPSSSETSTFPAGKVDIKVVDKNILTFLDKITFAVNQSNYSNCLFKEMKTLRDNKNEVMLIYNCLNQYIRKCHQESFSTILHTFNPRIELTTCITEQNIIKNVIISFKTMLSSFSNTIINCDILFPCLLLNLSNSDIIPSSEKGVSKKYSFYIPTTFIRSKIFDNVELNFEIFFISCLTYFATQSKFFIFTPTSVKGSTYIFEFILKEGNTGILGKECLDLYTDFDEENYFFHNNVTAKLTDKSKSKILDPPLRVYELSEITEECFHIFLKLLSKEEELKVYYVSVIDKLLNTETKILKQYIGIYSNLINKISKGYLLKIQKDYIYNRLMKRIKVMKFSEFISSLNLRKKNFKILCMNHLDSNFKFKHLKRELKTKDIRYFRIIPVFFDSYFYCENFIHYVQAKVDIVLRSFYDPQRLDPTYSDALIYVEDMLKTLLKYKKIFKFKENISIADLVRAIINRIYDKEKISIADVVRAIINRIYSEREIINSLKNYTLCPKQTTEDICCKMKISKWKVQRKKKLKEKLKKERKRYLKKNNLNKCKGKVSFKPKKETKTIKENKNKISYSLKETRTIKENKNKIYSLKETKTIKENKNKISYSFYKGKNEGKKLCKKAKLNQSNNNKPSAVETKPEEEFFIPINYKNREIYILQQRLKNLSRNISECTEEASYKWEKKRIKLLEKKERRRSVNIKRLEFLLFSKYKNYLNRLWDFDKKPLNKISIVKYEEAYPKEKINSSKNKNDCKKRAKKQRKNRKLKATEEDEKKKMDKSISLLPCEKDERSYYKLFPPLQRVKEKEKINKGNSNNTQKKHKFKYKKTLLCISRYYK